MTRTPPSLTCLPVTGVGEVRPGDDLAAVLLHQTTMVDGDVLVVTSKVVSKAEGRVRTGERSAALAAETDRIVARRGQTSIVRTHHGLVMAAGGIDASNTEPGTVVLLPVDPDGSARALREQVAARTGCNVAVLVTDTSGRAWRNGQTDIAIGAAGIDALHDFAGRMDHYGNRLAVTAPALADELAGAADLVKGKLRNCPAAVVRGLADLVLPRGRHGSGATALVRAEAGDMFGYGTREAVERAVTAAPADLRGFGFPCPAEELAGVLDRLAAGAVTATVDGPGRVSLCLRAPDARRLGRLEARLSAVAFSRGWTELDPGAPGTGGDQPEDHSGDHPSDYSVLRFVPGTP